MTRAFFALLLVLVGCSTNNTVEKRRSEKSSSYHSLTPEFRSLVDQGQIKEGMPADAVYLAWGEPSDVFEAEDARGRFTKWIYTGSYLQRHDYWAFRPATQSAGRDYYRRPESPVMERRLEHDVVRREYVQAEVDLVDGVVRNWRKHPKPR